MGNIPINTIKQATVYFYNYIPELTIITSKKTYYLSRISFENKEDSFENTQDDMIKIFHPNFMSIFLKTLILPIIYYYYEIDLKVYGDINYLCYSIIYFILLLATCYFLYHK